MAVGFFSMIPLVATFCFLFVSFGSSTSKVNRWSPSCCHNRIVGGNDTDISQVPYQAALLWGDYYFCGAAIISDRFLVTGAHCIVFFFQMQDSDDDEMIIRVGSNYCGKGGIIAKAKNTVCHPDFDFDNYDYDICIIELKSPLKFSNNVQPVKIGNYEPKQGEIGRVAGWGTLWEGGKVPEKLQSVLIPVANKTACKEAYEKISPITERMFCAGEEGKDSCQGDSGGGMVVNGLLLGVISSGFGCGLKNYPGVYTSVAHPNVRKFVKEVTKI